MKTNSWMKKMTRHVAASGVCNDLRRPSRWGFLRARSLRAAPFVLALGIAPYSAHAQLLTAADQTKLETWLGSGPQEFTQIFSAVNGDGKTAEDFNAAADNKGPTFTLASVTRGGITSIIGGYDPLSWDGAEEDYNYAYSVFTRTAFIFNLSSDTVQRENENASGDWQTLNASSIGPTWGQSFDLAFGDYSGIGPDTLNYGSTFNYSYGGSFGTDILGDPDEFIDGDRGVYDPFTVNVLDVYTFAPVVAGVPDTGSTAAMLGAAILGLALFHPRRRLA